MANVFSSIAISPSGTTLLNALEVTTSAGVVLNEAVTLVDASNPANVGSVLASGAVLIEPGQMNAMPVTGTFFPATQTVTGTVMMGADGTIGAAVGTVAAVFGIEATTVYPTAVTSTALIPIMGDKVGRPAVVLNSVRDLAGAASLVLTATAAVQFIAAGASGVFNDITTLIITSPQTVACAVTLNDNGTSGNAYTINLAANGGIAQNFPTPLKQGTAAASWTAALAAAGTVSCLGLYVANK
jgi:hypothetical protein